jgi:hypothetical protein
MEAYYVTLRDKGTGGRWTMRFEADDYAHAEEQAIDTLDKNEDSQSEIISIEKDYA